MPGGAVREALREDEAAERWFSELTQKQIRRGTLKNVAERIAAIEEVLAVTWRIRVRSSCPAS